MAGEKNILLLSELAHVDVYQRFLDDHVSIKEEGYILVALDAEIEYVLTQQGIPFVSAGNYRTQESTLFLLADTWATDFEKKINWCRYKDIQFSGLFIYTLQAYLRQYLYYVGLLDAVLMSSPSIEKIYVLATTEKKPTRGAFLSNKQLRLVEDSVQLLASQRGLMVEVVGDEKLHTQSIHTVLFSVQHVIFVLCISLFNVCIGVLRGRGKIRILVSDYWRNVSPILPHISGVEVIFWDRKEFFNARLKNIWRYKVRFMHSESFRSKKNKYDSFLEELQEKWHVGRKTLPTYTHGGVSFLPIVTNLFEEMLHSGVPRAIHLIDELYCMFEKLKPDIVLLRATVSQQWHFPLLALVAKQKGVPSFELLHGMEYPGPGSLDRRHEAEFVGVYGMHNQRQLVGMGFSAGRLPIIGSPRFDSYVQKGVARHDAVSTAKKTMNIFCTAPDLFVGATFDTYAIERYFKDVALATSTLPNVSVMVKLRPGPRREMFYRRSIAEAFAGVAHTVAQYESLSILFPQVDVVVSCQSTVTLEALQCGVPLIVYAATPVEDIMLNFNFKEFVDAGAVLFCRNPNELAQALTYVADPENVKKIKSNTIAFLSKEYAFDGKAAERTAEFIEKITQK